MHRTFPRFLGWWSLLLALALLVGGLAATAQTSLPTGINAPALPPTLNNQTIELAVGSSRYCQMTTHADLKRVENPNSRVVRVERLPNKNNEILLVAENPGRSLVTFVDQNDRVEVHEVVVAFQPGGDAKKLIMQKGGIRTLTLEKNALGGVQATVGGIINVRPTDKANIFTIEAIASGTTRLTFYADAKKSEVIATYEVEVPLEDRVTQLRDLIKKIAPADAIEVTPLTGSRTTLDDTGAEKKEKTEAVLLSGTSSSFENVRLIDRAANALFPPTLIKTQGGEGGVIIDRTRIDSLNVINQIKIGGVHQVQLEVVVAIVNRSAARNMAFSWHVTGNNWFLSSLIGGPGLLTSSLTTAPGATASTLTGASSAANIPFGVLNNDSSVLGFLQLLRTEGLTKVLAEPRLVTLSGRSAKIVSGGHVDIVSAGGVSSSQISADFGTIVTFLPIVLGNGKIHLEVAPEVSTPTNTIPIPGAGNAGTVSFSVLKRSANVAVQMEDGQTLAIGGLIQNRVDSTASKVPVFGDLPLIGAAFRNMTYTETEEEMLILVTPRLVDPVDCTKIPRHLPGRETRTPGDFELFLEGILEAPRGQRTVNFHHHMYKGAFQNSPNYGQIPCGDATGSHRNGGCASGNCGTGGQNLSGVFTPRYDNSMPSISVPGPSYPEVPAVPASNQRIILEPEIPTLPSTGLGHPTMPRQQDARPVLPPLSIPNR